MAEHTYINLRAEQAYKEKIKKLNAKLGLRTSDTVRLALDEAVAKYIEPGFAGEIVVLNKEFLNTILGNLQDRIRELENPQGQLGDRVSEAKEAAERVDELRKQGKHAEADKLLREREKKGLYTASLSWEPDKKP